MWCPMLACLEVCSVMFIKSGRLAFVDVFRLKYLHVAVREVLPWAETNVTETTQYLHTSTLFSEDTCVEIFHQQTS